MVADGKGKLLRKPEGEYYVRPGRMFGGLVNLRYQVALYQHPPEEEGKPVGQMRPRRGSIFELKACRESAVVYISAVFA